MIFDNHFLLIVNSFQDPQFGYFFIQFSSTNFNLIISYQVLMIFDIGLFLQDHIFMFIHFLIILLHCQVKIKKILKFSICWSEFDSEFL